MRRHCASALAAALLFTGCSDSGPDNPDASPTSQDIESPSDESTETAPAVDPKARKTLRSSFVQLMKANTGSFSVLVPFGDGASIREAGQYQVKPVATDVVRDLTSPEGTLRVAYRGLGEDAWIRIETVTDADADPDGASQSWPCWVDYDDITKLASAVAEQLPLSPAGQPPAAIVLASYAVGQQIVTPQRINGTTDLTVALGLISGKLVLASGIDPEADSTVPASFILDGKNLAGVTVQMSRLPDAVADAGGEVTTEISSLTGAPGQVTALFDSVGKPIDIQAPAPSQILKFTGPDDFERAMQACGTPPE